MKLVNVFALLVFFLPFAICQLYGFSGIACDNPFYDDPNGDVYARPVQYSVSSSTLTSAINGTIGKSNSDAVINSASVNWWYRTDLRVEADVSYAGESVPFCLEMNRDHQLTAPPCDCTSLMQIFYFASFPGTATNEYVIYNPYLREIVKRDGNRLIGVPYTEGAKNTTIFKVTGLNFFSVTFRIAPRPTLIPRRTRNPRP